LVARASWAIDDDKARHPTFHFFFCTSSRHNTGRIHLKPYFHHAEAPLSFPAPNMAQVKQDPDRPYMKQEYIKQDPDSKDTALADIEEEDLYEDAGDLDFTNADRSVWLSRLPRQLWEHWAHLGDDEEIEIGTMRVEGKLDDIKRVSGTMRLQLLRV
jgi:hypothetical protein